MKKIASLVLPLIVSFLCAESVGATPIARVLNSYPSRGAQNVNVSTSIGATYSIALNSTLLDPDSVMVIGSKNGHYSGSVNLSTNGRTLIFKPSHPFAGGERIDVHLGGQLLQGNALTDPYDFSFTTARVPVGPDTNFHSDDPILEHLLHKQRRHEIKGNTNDPLALSDSSLPLINVMTDINPSQAQMYVANYKFYVSEQQGTYRMILNPDGSVAVAQGGGPDYYNDFKPHPNGIYSYFDVLNDKFYMLGTAFDLIDSLEAANGYQTDGHEFRITPDGNYVIIADDYETIDMSKIVPGGDTTATVLVPVIQEFDQGKNLIFEWKTIDHFLITDATEENLLAKSIDFNHMNAIEFDSDSNFVISSRHMDEITKIDKLTGDIIWRMGGKNNQFTFYGDSIPYSHQHAIRRIANGDFTMFDNGNFRESGALYSRALEFRLDQVNKTATEVWQFRHTPDVYGLAMGYVERLPNGNTLIGWGACDDVSVTELDAANTTQFEMVMDSGNYSYRAYKYDSTYIHGGPVLAAVQPVHICTTNSVTCVPNPVSSSAQLHVALSSGGPANITLYDVLGMQAASIFTGTLQTGETDIPFQVSNLAAGVFDVHIVVGGNAPIDEKIIVSK